MFKCTQGGAGAKKKMETKCAGSVSGCAVSNSGVGQWREVLVVVVVGVQIQVCARGSSWAKKKTTENQVCQLGFRCAMSNGGVGQWREVVVVVVIHMHI
jgi:hypothetical protein